MEVSSVILKLDPSSKAESRVSILSAKSYKGEDRQEITYILPKLVASACACVLENAVDSLVILGNMMDLPKVNVDLDYKPLGDKYSEPFRECIYDPETLETRAEALEKSMKMKFHTDRSYLEKILREAVLELSADKSFDKLMKRIGDYEKTIQEEEQFLSRTADLVADLRKFEKHVRDDKVKLQHAIQVTSENVGKMKDEYEVGIQILSSSQESKIPFSRN